MRTLTIFILIFSFSKLSAQEWDFRVGGSYFSDIITTEERTSTFASVTALNDSLGLQTTRQQTSIDSTINRAIISYDFGIGKQINVMNNLDVRIGAGLNLTIFNQRRGFNFLGSTILSVDTVTISGSIFEPTGFTCDEFLNSSLDFDFDPNVRISMLDFELNGGIQYALMGDRLGVGTSLVVSTPVFTERFRSLLILNDEEVDGQTICEFESVEDRDRSGDGFRNLKLGVDFFLESKIQDKYGIQIGFNKKLSNAFIVHQSPFSAFQPIESQFSPASIFLRLSISLNKHQQMIDEEI